jgi:hypothetical protein
MLWDESADTLEVSGTVVADGLTVDSVITLGQEGVYDAFINAPESFYINIDSDGTQTGRKFQIGTNSTGISTTKILTASDNGDISFYEDTGTTAKFFWDASAEALGLGTVLPDGALHVHTGTAGTVSASSQADELVLEGSAETGMTIISPDDQSARIRFTSPSTNTDLGGASIFYRQNINKMSIGTEVAGGVFAIRSGAGTEAINIDSSGRVLIGATSSQDVLLSSGNALQLQGLTSNTSGISTTRHSADSGGPYFNFGKTRGTADGAVTVVQDLDILGQVFWSGADGTDIQSAAASIQGLVDGTPGVNDMPGMLRFSTTADGASTPTERMRINNAGDVTIGNAASARARLEVYDSGVSAVYDAGDLSTWRVMQVRNNIESFSGTAAGIAFGGDGSGDTETAGIVGISDNSTGGVVQLGFLTAAGNNSIEAMRIDSSQRVLIGLTTSEAVASTTAADLQVVTGGIGVSIVSTASASGPAGVLALGHKRGAGGVVLDDDGLGDIRFAGHDGTDLESQAAIIRASVDGTPGSNDMPGRLEFYTTADGAAASTERMRINSAGDVKIGSAGTPQTKLQVQSGSIENGTILMGANYNGTGMNQNSEKSGALHHPVYVSDTSPKGYRLIGGYADSTRNMVQIGGGTNSAKAATQIVLYTGASATASSNTEAMRIDSLQRVLMGAGTDATSTITDGWWNGSTLYSGILNIQNVNDGTAQKYVSLAVSRHSNDIESGQLGFAKSRGSTANSKTTVGNGDTLGIITFQGADGSNLVEAARILVATDNPASGDDMPGRLQFYTTADGASSPTERMRINSNGAMLFDVESGGIMAMRVGTSAGVATDCFEINLSGATFACYVDVVTNQSAGYAGRTSQFLWYARRAPAGNSRGTVELSTNSLGSVNAGVVAVATITASATNPTGTLERFQITTNLATDSIYCIIRAIGNIPTLKILN